MGCSTGKNGANIDKAHQNKAATELKKPQSVDLPKTQNSTLSSFKKQEQTKQHVTKKEGLKLSSSTFILKQAGKLKENYKILKVIGDGAFGKVRSALHLPTQTQRAIKTISKESVDKTQGSEQFFAEVEILKSMDHPNILRLFEFYEDERNYHLVTELCTGGELFDKIVDITKFSEVDAAKIMQQILSAIVYCHSKLIVHRDLKPENLLLEDESEKASIKIIDFGTSSFFDPSRKMNQKFGTPYYIAPEVLNRRYDYKCDIWSCGVILYVLLCGYPPFSGNSDDVIFQKVQKGAFSFDDQIWNSISEEAKDLIKKMLIMEPDQRPNASDCLNHKWIIERVSKEIVEEPLAQQSLQNLKNFRSNWKLTQAVTTFIVSQLTSKEEKSEMQCVFTALDTNHDGKLSKEELYEGFRKHMDNLDAETEVNRIMQEVDIDGSGFIDFTEFITATLDRKKILQKEKIEAAFKAFDKDASGSISSQELKNILGGEENIQESVWKEIIKEVDKDGNGEVDLKEFKEMLLNAFS